MRFILSYICSSLNVVHRSKYIYKLRSVYIVEYESSLRTCYSLTFYDSNSQIFTFLFCRSGLSTDSSKFTFAELIESDDEQDSREERAFRMWINSLGIEYVSSLFEDVRDGYGPHSLIPPNPTLSIVLLSELHVYKSRALNARMKSHQEKWQMPVMLKRLFL